MMRRVYDSISSFYDWFIQQTVCPAFVNGNDNDNDIEITILLS